MRELPRAFGWKDGTFLAALLILGLVLTAGIYSTGSSGSYIQVTLDGTLYGSYALTKEQRISIQRDGKLLNEICISDGAARVTQATCPDGHCQKQGAISRAHQTIVCLPHKLVVEVYGDDERTYDTISQ